MGLVQSVRGDEHEVVGIGVPSVVDFETARILSSVNVPLGDPGRPIWVVRCHAASGRSRIAFSPSL